MALASRAQRALAAGDSVAAGELFGQASILLPGHIDIKVGHALAATVAGDLDAAVGRWDAVLALEPRHLLGLLMKGAALEKRGDFVDGAQTFNAALAVAPPFSDVPDDLKPLVRQAVETVSKFRKALEDSIRSRLSTEFGALQGRESRRIAEALDIFLGRKQIFPQKPHNLYVPGLPTIQFYDREEFPWLAAIEAETEAIKAEFVAVATSDADLVPYVDYPDGIPLDQWAELNRSLRWGVFHLMRDGAEVPANAIRCPRTMAAMKAAPTPRLPNRSPAAMFSILKPRTRIPPHTGVTNARLVVHIPLIVPEGCAFRVGNDVRPWRVGEAFIFNDTIEHEAWNDSDRNRAVLIFDIWNPGLTDVEKAMIAALFEGNDAYAGLPNNSNI